MTEVSFAGGRGKYGDLLEVVLEVAEAKQGILLIVDGNQGPGSTMTMSLAKYPMTIEVLRKMADDMEKTIAVMGVSREPS